MTCETGDLSGGLVLVNDTFGNGLLNDGNGIAKAFLGLLCGLVFQSIANVSDRFFDLGLIAFVSYPSDLILSGPL